MLHEASVTAVIIFAAFVASVVGFSFWLGRRGQSATGYYAAHGQVPWFVNGIAFAGDYLSAASFLGICGLIAFNGYDGFLYSIGFLAGWIVALFVIAEPIKSLGKFTFADALDARFNSRGIKLVVAISTLVVSIFYLIPQMVGAGDLITPLLGLPHAWGVILVGATVTWIVVTAGMVSTTWVQFIKGSLLVVVCGVLVVMILGRGLAVNTEQADLAEQVRTVTPDGDVLIDGQPQTADHDLRPVGSISELPGGKARTGPLGPLSYLATLEDAKVVTWSKRVETDEAGTHTTYYPVERRGGDLLVPGGYFKGLGDGTLAGKLNFASLMLALFCGTASLPHILIRYYTVKDKASARKSTVVGIAAIGGFYVLTLYLGLSAMTSNCLDPTTSNMAAPLLAKSFNETLFAVISAIAFTTVLGTVSGLIMAGSGAVAHDLLENVCGWELDDHEKVRCGKVAAVVLGLIAMVLGILFRNFNVSFLVGWAFNIAASANLPALVMVLFWPKTTKQGVIAAVTVGMVASLGWILLSADTFEKVYGIAGETSLVPFSQPGLVTIPLGFITLVAVSLMTQRRAVA
ncbi:cation acetate symporter [bacterium]|jgi:cation/acetate symporter|nr:cation acetate symporter [Pirellulales bacterium]NBP80538.1 cation acetate symporter [bacterium]